MNVSDLLSDIGTRGTVSVIMTEFANMEVAEAEIKAAQQRHPEHADVLHSAFLMCITPPVLRELDNRLYASHVRELLERVAAGEDTRPATDAELIGYLHYESLAHPLSARFYTLYCTLFTAQFPEHAEKPPAELWPGANTELTAELRRKLRVPDRTIS